MMPGGYRRQSRHEFLLSWKPLNPSASSAHEAIDDQLKTVNRIGETLGMKYASTEEPVPSSETFGAKGGR
jgi:hypothetical protein